MGPGWYEDPADPTQLCWWDGQRFTAHRSVDDGSVHLLGDDPYEAAAALARPGADPSDLTRHRTDAVFGPTGSLPGRLSPPGDPTADRDPRGWDPLSWSAPPRLPARLQGTVPAPTRGRLLGFLVATAVLASGLGLWWSLSGRGEVVGARPDAPTVEGDPAPTEVPVP